MKFLKLLSFTLVFFCIIHTAIGQKAPMKFGKINNDNLKANVCPIDSNAHAYYLFDYGVSSFVYLDTKIVSNESSAQRKGFQIDFVRHFRIKILDNQAFDWANVEIPLYHSENAEEKLTSVKAFTFNLEGGKVVKSKLDKGEIIREKKNDNVNIVKFALPNVKEGSIIDVKYTIKSDYLFNLQDWAFQKSIPVMESEYHIYVPEYFIYKQTLKGYFPVEIEESSRVNKFTITFEQKAEGLTAGYETEETFEYIEYAKHYTAKNIPAFPDEEYIRSRENYISKVEYELASTEYPNQPIRYYTVTWEEINRNLMEDRDFGMELKSSGFMKDDVEVLSNMGLQGVDLMNAAFMFIKNNFTWNRLNRVKVTKTLRSAYKEKTGSSADINLNLVLLLRKLGFDAYPVLLSTKNNGLIHPAHPSLSKFNYAIALVKLNGEEFLMDATDPLAEINTLPLRCLNERGRIIDLKAAAWVDLQQGNSFKSQCVYNISLDQEGVFSGDIAYKYQDYAAYLKRKEIKANGDIKNYIDELQEDNSGLLVNDYNISNLDTLNDKLIENYEVRIEDQTESAGDVLYFSPLLFESWKSNPFKLEKREYPVEYDYPLVLNHTMVIEVPENFVVETLPKPQIFTTPDKSFRYTYNVVVLGNKIQITSLLTRKKMLYLPEEYDFLKAFYDMVIAKQNEKVVLKMN